MREITDQKKLRIWTLFTQCITNFFRKKFNDIKCITPLWYYTNSYRTQELITSYARDSQFKPSVVTEICDPNKSTAQHYRRTKNVLLISKKLEKYKRPGLRDWFRLHRLRSYMLWPLLWHQNVSEKCFISNSSAKLYLVLILAFFFPFLFWICLFFAFVSFYFFNWLEQK